MSQTAENSRHESRLVRTGRREAAIVILIWAAVLGWSVGYCATHGYDRAVDDLSFVLGFPDWVFWGIMVPWLACYAISVAFAMFVMQDAPLEDDSIGSDLEPGEAADA